MATSNNDFVYALGGISNTDQALTSVEFSRLQSNGDLSRWQTTIPLPQARIYAAAVIVGQHIYVIGGGTGETGSDNLPTADVIRAKILSNGRLESWQPTLALSSARWGLKVFANKKLKK
jgi:hypothetical protein